MWKAEFSVKFLPPNAFTAFSVVLFLSFLLLIWLVSWFLVSSIKTCTLVIKFNKKIGCLDDYAVQRKMAVNVPRKISQSEEI